MRNPVYYVIRCDDKTCVFQDPDRNECTILKDTYFGKDRKGKLKPCTFKKPRKKEKDR